MALQKKVKKFLSYIANQSSIHGLKHLSNPKYHYVERIIWFIFIIFAIFGVIETSKTILQRYQRNPTVISIEKNHIFWNTSFPAATICPHEHLDNEKVENYIATSPIKDKIKLRKFLYTLSNASYNNFEYITMFDEIPKENFLNIIKELKYNFTFSLTGNRDSSKISIHEVVTEMGICYTFNSFLAVYSTPHYLNSGKWDLIKQNKTLYVNVLDGEVLISIREIFSGFDLYIHGSYEVPDIASQKISFYTGYFYQLSLLASILYSSKSIYTLSVNQRKCRFYYEGNLRYSPVYSYVLCRMECRALLAKRFCGCVPHFYRKIDGELICNVNGLHCLSKFKDRLILLKGECNCLPNCDEVNYIKENMEIKEWYWGSTIQWGFKTYPKMRLRRDVIFGFSNLLVYIGGIAGLFLGCSVLSLIELIYFLTFRFYWYIRGELAKKA